MKHNYLIIKQELERRITAGELAPGERLPPEIEMAKAFGVSRETLRMAVKQLEREGKLRARRGIGRFVMRLQDSIPSSIERLASTSEMIRSAGLVEEEYQESIHTVPCNEEWAYFLDISPGTPVIVNERMRTANGEPVTYNINVLPYALVGEAFEKKRLQGSLIKFLEQECGILIVSSNTELVVPLPADVYAHKLKRHPDTTVLLLKQTHYDEDQLPVFFSYDYYRNDVFKFWVKRIR